MITLRQIREMLSGRVRVIPSVHTVPEIEGLLTRLGIEKLIPYQIKGGYRDEGVIEEGTCSPGRALEMIRDLKVTARPIELCVAQMDIYAQRKQGGNLKFYADVMHVYAPWDNKPTRTLSLVFVK